MLSESTLSQFCDLVSTHLGLHFSRERQGDLEYRLNQIASAFDFAHPEACVNWLLTAPLTQKQIDVLAHHLTVGETYFFRDRHSCEALRLEILPALIQNWDQTGISPCIWSAGCCTGEEPYSIAILLDQLLPKSSRPAVRILATDVNPVFLQKAKTGVYSDWSFRETPDWIKEKYFKRKGPAGHFELVPQIRKQVTFAYSNLANPCSFPELAANSVNLILCRNVLMYFDAQSAHQIVQFFDRVLASDGWLLVSPSELSQVLFAPFQLTTVAGALCYTKHLLPARPWFEQPELIPVTEEVTIQPELTLEGLVPTQDAPVLEPEIHPSPISPESRYAQALELYEARDYEPAMTTLQALLAVEPTNTLAMTLCGRICANQGLYDQAFEWCQVAIATDKLTTAAYYLLATIYQEQNQIEAAVTALKQALYIEPNFIIAHFTLGVLALGQGWQRDSEKQLRIALLLLATSDPQATVPHSEGMTAGQLTATIQSLLGQFR